MALVPLADATYAFASPGLCLIGPGCSKEAGAQAKGLGATHVLLVTDKMLAKLGMVDRIKEQLEGVGLKVTVFDGVEPDPSDKNVQAGAELYQASRCDALVSLGGGSSHDCAKGIGVVVTSGGNIRDYAGLDKLKARIPPLVAINTTAGTGSEASRTAVITNTERNMKTGIVDSRCVPAIAINDPRLMVGMPPALTAATGMDALTHAVESYVSIISTPLTDACGMRAIKLIARWLRPAVANGTNLEARDKMAYAEYLAGLAFANGRLGCVHAVALPLCSRYHIPHGVGCAVMLPYVCEFNLIAAPERFAEIAAAMGEKIEGLTVMEAAARAPAAIRSLNLDIGLAANLTELGVKEADWEWLAQNAVNDVRLTNPRQPTGFDEMLPLIRTAMGTALVKTAGA
jgi:alcohol dehydrogenase